MASLVAALPAAITTSPPPSALVSTPAPPVVQSEWKALQTPTTPATQPATAQNILGLCLTAGILLFAVLFQQWSTFISATSFLVRSALCLLLSVGIPLLLFPRLPGWLIPIASFGAALLVPLLAPAPFWPLLVFSMSCVVAQILRPSTPASSPRPSTPGLLEPALQRVWMNGLLKLVIEHISALKIRRFDIGSTIPSFQTIEILPHLAGGMDVVVRYDYLSDASTLIELEVPIPIPGYGETIVPVTVAGPQLSGKVRIRCTSSPCRFKRRVLNASLDSPLEEKTETFLAVAVLFEPIEEVHVSDVRVSIAPKFEWLQWFSFVKRQIVQLFNSLLSTEKVSLYLFDESFTTVGSLLFDAPRDITLRDVPIQDMFNVQQLLDEQMMICLKCSRKSLPNSIGCCPCEKLG